MAGIVLRVKVDNSQLEQIAHRAPAIDGVIGVLAAEQVVTAARLLVPVDTGYLKGSITKGGAGGAWFVEAAAHYSSFVEYGTRKMRAQPYLRPALENIDWEPILATALRWLGL